MQQTLSRRILLENQFENHIVGNLIQFGIYLKSVSSEYDAFIFMARKAICLVDVLEALGFPLDKTKVVSDRILDINPSSFEGRKVALVDDTLIVGTTLSEAKNKLVKAGVSEVKVFTFCADDTWNRNYIQPDYIQLILPSDQLLTFCIGEVRAFSVLNRPYLVDFPILGEVEVNYKAFLKKISDKTFTYNLITIPNQVEEDDECEMYSLLPSHAFQKNIFQALGVGIQNITQIFKYRIFIQRENEIARVKIVPIVTLEPLTKNDIDHLFNSIVGSDPTTDGICEVLSTSEIRQRFIQYFLSAKIGLYLTESLKSQLPSFGTVTLSQQEIGCYFGHRLSKTICHIIYGHQTTIVHPYSIAQLPEEQNEYCTAILTEKVSASGNILYDLFDIFAKLFIEKEIPIRKGNTSQEGIARLKNGISFGKVIEFIKQNYEQLDIEEPRIKSYVSVALDVTNDWGASIPITCVSNDGSVVYRAYRHGELGLRTKEVDYLLHEFIGQFLDSNLRSRDSIIDHLLLEKLMVLFFRIATTEKLIKKFNEDEHDRSSVINLGWYLMGAILTTKYDSSFPNRYEDWLLYTLINEKNGILQGTPIGDNKFEYCLNPNYLKTIGQGEFNPMPDSGHIYLARDYGAMLGSLYQKKSIDDSKYSYLKNSPLDIRSMVLLSTCNTIEDTAMALAAEVIEFYAHFSSRVKKRFEVNFVDRNSIKKAINDLTNSNGYASFNQAFLKYYGAFDNDALFKRKSEILDFCREFQNALLTRLENLFDRVLRLKTYSAEYSSRTKDELGELISNCARLLFENGNTLLLYRVLLEWYLNCFESDAITTGAMIAYECNGQVHEKQIVRLKKEEIDDTTQIAHRTNLANALKGKKIGDTISVTLEGVTTVYVIKSFHNRMTTTNAEHSFEEFNANVRDTSLGELNNYALIKNKIEKFKLLTDKESAKSFISNSIERIKRGIDNREESLMGSHKEIERITLSFFGNNRRKRLNNNNHIN